MATMTATIKYSGCSEGRTYEFSAGANRGVARLDLQTPEIAIVGARRIALTYNLLVLWHKGDSGTFHGWYDPAVFAACPHPCRGGDPYNYQLEQRATKCPPITPSGVVSSSSSGGGQAVAAVVEIPPSGIVYVTSGYDGRRGWVVHTVTLSGVVAESLQDYRARVSPIEILGPLRSKPQ